MGPRAIAPPLPPVAVAYNMRECDYVSGAGKKTSGGGTWT